MIATFPSRRCNCWSLVLIALVVSQNPARSAMATVLDFESLVNANTSLMHQYTFEGDTVPDRQQDKKGSLNLSTAFYDTAATANLISYVQGFDATTTAVVTVRPGGDTASDGGGGGAGLTQTTNMAHPGTTQNERLRMTVEVLFRPDQATLTGGQGGLGFVTSMLEQPTQRGYFLYQGAATQPSANAMSSLAGSSFNPANQQTILPSFQAGDWYYFATTYESSTLPFSTTNITSYVANLSDGETMLTALGTINVPGLFTNGGLTSSKLGIGIVPMDAVNGTTHRAAFPGGIDSVAVYSTLLDQTTFQAHLDAIYFQDPGPPAGVIPEPSSLGLMLSGLAMLITRRRVRK